MYQATVRNSGAWDGTLRSDWSFDTIRSTSAMGSLRSMARDLNHPETIPDEDDYEDGGPSQLPSSVDTEGATKGSDGLMSNPSASHSTVVIRSPIEREIPSLIPDTGSDEAGYEPATPPSPAATNPDADDTEPPPAYTGSVRSTRSSSSARRASYAERHNLTTGTVLVAADLGTGVDTIRPVKKVDTIRSVRLSEEFMGSIRKERAPSVDGGPAGAGSPPSSPVSPKSSGHKRQTSQIAHAGRAMVNEVLLPTLEKVRVLCFRAVM